MLAQGGWECATCMKPAVTIVTQFASMLHYEPPKLGCVSGAFTVCEKDKCRTELVEWLKRGHTKPAADGCQVCSWGASS